MSKSPAKAQIQLSEKGILALVASWAVLSLDDEDFGDHLTENGDRMGAWMCMIEHLTNKEIDRVSSEEVVAIALMSGNGQLELGNRPGSPVIIQQADNFNFNGYFQLGYLSPTGQELVDTVLKRGLSRVMKIITKPTSLPVKAIWAPVCLTGQNTGDGNPRGFLNHKKSD